MMAGAERLKVWARGAAASMVKVIGANAISLRVAAPAGATDADELGVVAGGFSEVLIAPVLVRETYVGADVLVSADVLHRALALEDAQAVRKALMDGEGVSALGAWIFVKDVAVREVAGEPYLYRLSLSRAKGSA